MTYRLLDLFCGAGGCTKGYQRAGFLVTGVDINPQPRYCGDVFYQADALEFVKLHGHEFDAISASPPCQGYSSMAAVTGKAYAMLIPQVRELLCATGKPYVIENVAGARNHMIHPLKLKGTMFGLMTFRERLFESNIFLMSPTPLANRAFGRGQRQGCAPTKDRAYICVTGSYSGAQAGRDAMGIQWMRRHELTQAIPPAYTEFIGRQLMAWLELNAPAPVAESLAEVLR